MAAPSITSITFDKASYSPGETIKATVVYTPGTSESVQTFTGTATDSITGQTGNLSVAFTTAIVDPTTVSVADSGGRIWVRVSDGVGMASFTAVA